MGRKVKIETTKGRVMIGFSKVGSGKQKVMVLHGWLGDHTVFAPIMPLLDQDLYTYVFIDYRGYGASTEIAGDYTVEEISGDAIELADHLDWDRFHVIGHSMGGKVAQHIAAVAPKRIQSVTALTAVPASGVPMDDDGWGLFSGAIEKAENRYQIIDFTTGGRLSAKWINTIVAASYDTTTLPAFAGYLESWVKGNFLELAQGLKVPFNVIAGQHDGALTEQVMKDTFMAWYPNAQLEVLPGAGHYPMQETPVFLVAVIEKFLSEHS